MTDYTNISNVSVEPLAPVTSELMTSLRDNPIAISEGSVGAPNMYVGLAKRLQAGALGSWVFASCTLENVNYGVLVAGSSLRPTSGAYAFSQTIDGVGEVSFAQGGTLSGTWMCLGQYTKEDSVILPGDPSQEMTIQGATLWMRTV